MRTAQLKEYRKLSIDELEDTLKKLKLELLKSYGIMGTARLESKKTGELKGSNMSKRIKQEIARVKTIIKEKQNDNKKVS